MDQTIYQAFAASAQKHQDLTALLYKKEGKYVPITYRELSGMVDSLAAALRGLGIGPADKVGVFSYNRPEWVIMDQAIMKLGGVVVPIYHMPDHVLPAPNVKYILNDAGVKLLFVENDQLLSVVDQIRSEAPGLRQVVCIERPKALRPGDLLLSDLLKAPVPAGDRPADTKAEDIATIVYTSGTTGEPKGVVLSHKNIVTDAFLAINTYHFTPEDRVISYLPLGHMLERTCGYYAVIFGGGSVGFAQDMTTVRQDAEAIRPTILLAVPRVIEKVYNEAVKKIEGGSPFKRGLVAAAVKGLNEYANLKYRKQAIPLGLKFKCAVYRKLVADKFRKLGGGRIRLIVVGGAPLNRQIAKIVYIFGFNIVEGYGLTETAPVVACNAIETNRLGTVGKPFPGIEVRIGENDEILVRGPNVMIGYHNKPEETAKVIDSDGWFHTGDQGKFDADGNLVITGRLKELIVTSGGKKIPPAAIEARISISPFVDQVILCGDGRNFLTALVVPQRTAVEYYARANGVNYETYSGLLESEEIKGLIKREIDQALADVPSYEKVKVFALLEQGFTVENELLTPTLKMKRRQIAERYAALLDRMYEKPAAGQDARNIGNL
jgi:long-chain acyl-CoA synthetase